MQGLCIKYTSNNYHLVILYTPSALCFSLSPLFTYIVAGIPRECNRQPAILFTLYWVYKLSVIFNYIGMFFEQFSGQL